VSSGLRWEDARAAAYAAGQAAALRPAAHVELAACAGRTLAADLPALLPVPHYASSAMDGWAIAGAGPWQLVQAGTPLRPGQAAPVVTGGLIPDGADSVLRSECGTAATQQLELCPGTTERELAAGRHIRPAGEETAAGAVVVAAGTVLTPAHLAVAAVCGHDALPVAAVPRVALLLTGDEVVTSGIPAPGRVRDTFGPTLPAIIARFGGQVADSRRLPDDFATTAEAIAGCGGDVVVTTGGTGTSAADHLRRVLDAAGATILVPSIRMRPGHPALLARLPDGRPLVGLPGNPLAAMMALLTLADPLLAGMTGRPPAPLRTVRAGTALRPLHNQDRLVPYGTAPDGGAVPADHIGSAMMRGLAAAEGVMVVPAAGADPGQQLPALDLPW
jgi:molybdopterin molybdotransferase